MENRVRRLERLNKDDFDEVWELMEDSFPVDERRTRQGQEALFDEPHYRMYGYRQGGALVAFIAVWVFDDFVFGEHFAVNRNLRNGGLGAKLLLELFDGDDEEFPEETAEESLAGRTLVLEVEPPENELASRRIGFYERNGCVLNPYDYIQPPMSENGEAIPLRIMSRPNALTPEEFEQARDILYREVYKRKK